MTSRSDGAPKGTSYRCFACGTDTRIDDKPTGVYVAGIGVKHADSEACSASLAKEMRSDPRYNDHHVYLEEEESWD